MPTILPITLCTAAALVLINLWLSVRIGLVRRAASISVGDGGHEPLARRMRAQLNFAENVPLVVILIAVLELGGITLDSLPWVAAIFVIARVLHGFGMDGGSMQWGRALGTVATMLVQLYLVGVAVGMALAQLT